MKIATTLVIFSILFSHSIVSSHADSFLSLGTTALLEAYNTVSKIDVKDSKSLGFAIELLTNLTIKLANSTATRCEK